MSLLTSYHTEDGIVWLEWIMLICESGITNTVLFSYRYFLSLVSNLDLWLTITMYVVTSLWWFLASYRRLLSIGIIISQYLFPFLPQISLSFASWNVSLLKTNAINNFKRWHCGTCFGPSPECSVNDLYFSQGSACTHLTNVLFFLKPTERCRQVLLLEAPPL